MVNVELADVDWVKPAVLAVVFLMYCVRVLEFADGFEVYRLALVSSSKGGSFRVSKFDSSRATD